MQIYCIVIDGRSPAGGIPAPVYFGALIDSTCLKWSIKKCGGRGACRIYESNKYRYDHCKPNPRCSTYSSFSLCLCLFSPGSSSWVSSLVSAGARISSSSPSSSSCGGTLLNQKPRLPPKRSSSSPHRTLLKILWMLPRNGKKGRGRRVQGRRVSQRPPPSPLSPRTKWREDETKEGQDRTDEIGRTNNETTDSSLKQLLSSFI